MHLFMFLKDVLGITALDNEPLKYTCDKLTKRRVLLPGSKSNKALENVRGDGLSMIPIVLQHKLNCRLKSAGKHMNILLYNGYTNELERIDIKKYHLDGFNLKLLVKKISVDFIPLFTGINSVDGKDTTGNSDLELIPDLDVSLTFIQKHGFKGVRDAFPIFLIAYLWSRSQKPGHDSVKVMKAVERLSTAKVTMMWEKYVAFCLKLREADGVGCIAGKVLIPLTFNPTITVL